MALCFEITINGGAPVIAGLEDINVLSAGVTYGRQEVEIQVGGLVSKSRHDNEHIDWLARALQTGDEILIRIIESSQPSAPVSRRRDDPGLAKRRERHYYERLKREHESE
jgi:hypothetical protein